MARPQRSRPAQGRNSRAIRGHRSDTAAPLCLPLCPCAPVPLCPCSPVPLCRGWRIWRACNTRQAKRSENSCAENIVPSRALEYSQSALLSADCSMVRTCQPLQIHVPFPSSPLPSSHCLFFIGSLGKGWRPASIAWRLVASTHARCSRHRAGRQVPRRRRIPAHAALPLASPHPDPATHAYRHPPGDVCVSA